MRVYALVFGLLVAVAVVSASPLSQDYEDILSLMEEEADIRSTTHGGLSWLFDPCACKYEDA